MSKTILLVQPPFGELYDIPFSTIATLTASLRAEGYTVIPRDLNVDFMHMIMNAQGATRICETMDRQIAALPDTGTDGPKQKKQLQVLVGGLRKKIPEIDGIYSAFTREVRAGAVTPDTYKKANNAYIAELLSVAMVTKPAPEGSVRPSDRAVGSGEPGRARRNRHARYGSALSHYAVPGSVFAVLRRLSRPVRAARTRREPGRNR
jgi:hypothetical protein